MFDQGQVTAAIETILAAGLPQEHTVVRNPRRNESAGKAYRGWVGIYRGDEAYEPLAVGGASPWRLIARPVVEVQRASMESAAAAEDLLEDSKVAVMTLLMADRKLGGTVGTTLGYEVAYEVNVEDDKWWHRAMITVICEART